MPRVTKQSPAVKPRRGKTSVVDRIRPIGFDGTEGIKINLYGRSGTGKTTLWATFPKPILAIVCSGGKRPGELHSIDTPEYRKTIEEAAIESSNEIRELVEYVAGGAPYSTVVLDHASGLQELVLKEVLGLEEVPTQLSWGLATQQQYGQIAVRVKDYLRALLSLECNVVIVAQEREFNTENSSDLIAPYVASALTPSIVGWLNPAVDYICQTFTRQKKVDKEIAVGKRKIVQTTTTREVEYCLRVGPDPVFTTKFRVPKRKMPDVVVDPDYGKIISIIKGKE